MAWRAMNSLLVLRDQVDEIAPARSRASDGLVGDTAHQQTDSAHNPHFVPGVGAQIVTAEDLTHDPAHGFDSYTFAEVLRVNRDARIKYVISNRRIFSSYSTPTRKAWTWGTYGGTDPHTNHVHVEVVENALADTKTPWNLEGFEADMTPAQQYVQHVINYRLDAIIHMRPTCSVPAFTATDGSKFPAFSEPNHLALAVLAADDSADPPATSPPLDLAALVDMTADEVTKREAAADRARAAALEAGQ